MDHNYQSQQGRPPTRRRALAETSSRGNEVPQAQRRGDKLSRDQMPSSSPQPLPHNESLVPNGSLAVRHEQQPSPENKRLSAVQAHGPRPHGNKRDSEVSNASTNASSTNRRRKTSIGPWQLGRTIGRGGCSRVRLVRHTGTGQYGAAKIISKATAEKVRALSLANLIKSAEQDVTTGKVIPFGLEREICIMKLLDHPNIVRLYDIWENRNELYLIMEYVEGGELFSFIHEQEGLIEIHAVHIFRQIIAALIYCHRINIHHRDLKPENILLDRDTMTVKLVDFGMAALQPVGKKLTTPCGSPHYAAPEVIKTTSYDGAKADVWSCGVILFVLLTGTPPFNYSGEDRHLGALFRDIQAAKYVMPDNLSPEAQDLIRRILVADPKRRIGLDDIWNHPFMRKYQKELNFVGEFATVDHWTGPLPAIAEWTSLKRDTVDREILRYLRTLWHSEKEEVLIQRLLSKEANQEKYFYSALRNYHTDQLENYQPDAHHAVAKSNSDHHHNTRHTPTRKDVEEMPSNKHQRSQSAYSILNNEHLYSQHSFYESPVSEASYDPYRASRQPIIPEQAVINQNVTIHREHSNASEPRKRRPATATGQHSTVSSLRVQALRNNSKRSSALSRCSSYRSTPSHRSASMKRRSMSRASLASSHWPSSPPVVARSGGIGRRGVSFSHLRDRRSSVATGSSIDYSAMAYTSDENTPVHRPHTSIGSYGTSDYGSSHQSSTRQPSSAYRSSKSRATPRMEKPRLRHRKPESPSKYIQTEARKVSTELGKAMEVAFNRSSIGSSVRTSGTEVLRDMSQYDTPPTSFSNTRDSGGSSILTPNVKGALAQRPLPPVPNETPNTFLQRKLAETRAEIARRYEENGDNTDHINEVLENLDRLMLPAPNSKRTVSAPAKSPEHPLPLHAIPEERQDSDDRFEQPYSPNYRAVTDPVRPQVNRAATEQQTIRLVDQSPTRIAPLNIRKRSGASINSRAAKEAHSVPWPEPVSNSTVRPYQDVQNDLHNARIAQQTTALDKKDPVIKKKKSLWFRRNTEERDRDEDKENQVKKKASTGLLQIPDAWHGLDDRLKIENNEPMTYFPPLTAKQPAKSNDSEFPIRNSSAPVTKSDGALRKGFLGLFGKKPKEDKGKRPMELGTVNFSSSSILSGFDLGAEHGGEAAPRTGPPEMQMNWLSRFLHIKPANKTLCFHIGRGKVRQDLVRLLRDWQRFGIRDVTFDRETNTITGRVDKGNHLKIKPVSFVIELFVVLEHGQRANLCLARFTQTRGAASSFRKVVDIVEDVCRARCMLIDDPEKQAAMMEVLD
ncbi:non-specific serine/threonine protein kinase [Parastagonospora nodorum]|nr:non-specific serine/threonine protein kinase [Parastagonospora nodorum]KAH5607134.1 non-specific serine/threonine protein kinase [Parastagonospora nodorum]KAH6444617.1 non-specific serine/threonine protein kinase [Parastagonospora nodorum]